MSFVSPTVLIAFVASALVFGIWYLNSQKSIKAKQMTVFVFRKYGVLERSSVDAKYGVAHLSDGGYLIRPTSMVHERSGRPWTTPNDEAHAVQLRSRHEVLFLREGDPAPMDFGSTHYIGATVTQDHVQSIQNQSHRLASMEAVVDGDPSDQMGRRLSLAVLLAVGAAIAAWVSVFAAQIMNGGQA